MSHQTALPDTSATQSWRDLDGRERTALAPGEEVGNDTGATLGEDGELLTADVQWAVSIVTLNAAYSTFDSTRSFPLELDRASLRVSVDVTDSIAIAGEYESWNYTEDLLPVAAYDADR